LQDYLARISGARLEIRDDTAPVPGAQILVGRSKRASDLGVDVPPSRFVEAIRIHHPSFLGMSALITSTMPSMAKVIEELEKASLKAQLKTIVGGAPLSEQYAKTIRADAFAPDAVLGVEVCKKWASGVDIA